MELKRRATTNKIFTLFVMIVIYGSHAMELDKSASSSSVIRQVEKNLFAMMGLQNRPVVDRTKTRIPPVVLSLYKKQMSNEYGSQAFPLPGKLTRSANVVRSYTHEESSIDKRFTHNHRFRLNFNLTDLPHMEVITASEVTLSLVPKEARISSHQQRVNVYDIIEPGIKGKTKPILRLTDTQLISTTSEATSLSLDVLPIIHRWVSDSSSNHGLLIDVVSSAGRKPTSSPVRLRRSVNDDGKEDWDAVQPILLVYSQNSNTTTSTTINWKNLKRPKRDTERWSPSTDHHAGECSRRRLRVDFQELGWSDWIMEPKQYEAYYCAGHCPSQFADHLNATNHAIVQSLMHTKHRWRVPGPCCIPTKLSSIHLLHLNDENRLVVNIYKNMVVDACGCR